LPDIFISYRREDTSGVAGHLAADLRSRFGRSNVFIDVDSILPGVDFEEKITHTLARCQVTFVLIGPGWAASRLPDGGRRLDEERDYVRREIAMALNRDDVTVVPVLVEGAAMPAEADLPAEIQRLSRLNASELSNKRWRFDVGQLSRIAASHDQPWSRWWHAVPRWALAIPVALAVVIAAVIILTAGGSVPKASAQQLVPATTPPKVNLCTAQLTTYVDGTIKPLECNGGKLNTLAWEYLARYEPFVMQAGVYATEQEVQQAICEDFKSKQVTVPLETQIYAIAALYYDWRFVLPPSPANANCP
jgi:TIR domain